MDWFILTKILSYYTNIELELLKSIKNKNLIRIITFNQTSNIILVFIMNDKLILQCFDIASISNVPEYEVDFKQHGFTDVFSPFGIQTILTQDNAKNIILFNMSTNKIIKSFVSNGKVNTISKINRNFFICGGTNIFLYRIDDINTKSIIKINQLLTCLEYNTTNSDLIYAVNFGDIKVVKINLNSLADIKQSDIHTLNIGKRKDIDYSQVKANVELIRCYKSNIITLNTNGFLCIWNRKTYKIREVYNIYNKADSGYFQLLYDQYYIMLFMPKYSNNKQMCLLSKFVHIPMFKKKTDNIFYCNFYNKGFYFVVDNKQISIVFNCNINYSDKIYKKKITGNPNKIMLLE